MSKKIKHQRRHNKGEVIQFTCPPDTISQYTRANSPREIKKYQVILKYKGKTFSLLTEAYWAVDAFCGAESHLRKCLERLGVKEYLSLNYVKEDLHIPEHERIRFELRSASETIPVNVKGS